MKKTLHNLGIATILLLLVSAISCSKSDSIVAPIVPPTGSVTIANNPINYGETITFTYSFTNANAGVWIGGKLMNSSSGTYTTGALFADSTFTIVARGSGGTLILPSIKVTVGMDPRVAVLISGTFICESLIFKPIDSSAASWTNAFPGCNTYVFQYNNQVGIPTNPPSIPNPPNNHVVMTYGPCTTSPGTIITSGWGFYTNGQIITLNGYTSTNILFWHGVFYDQFVIIYDPITLAPKGFKVHDYSALFFWNGALTSGESWETYKRL
jgi:hypothetical protein